MIIREAIEEDFNHIKSISRGIQKHCPEQVDFTYTLEHEGDPLMVGGFRLINLTTAWCWVDMSTSSRRHLRASYRTLKEWIDQFSAEHGIRRLQAYVECDFPEAVRMVEHLGFVWESDMENFMGDKDASMYKRIF